MYYRRIGWLLEPDFPCLSIKKDIKDFLSGSGLDFKKLPKISATQKSTV